MTPNQNSSKDWFFIWFKGDEDGEIVAIQKFPIDKYAAIEKHLGFTFILHKVTAIPDFDKWIYVESKSGCVAAISESFSECSQLFKKYKEKTKTEIFLDIAQAKKRIKKIEDKWRENQ